MNSISLEEAKGTGINDYIAEKLRHHRQRLGYTLSQVSAMLEGKISFQQLQKYERGTNRISSGRLYQIALLFSVPISQFYPLPKFIPDGSLKLSEENTQIEKIVQSLIAESNCSTELINLLNKVAQVEDIEQRKESLSIMHDMIDMLLKKND